MFTVTSMFQTAQRRPRFQKPAMRKSRAGRSSRSPTLPALFCADAEVLIGQRRHPIMSALGVKRTLAAGHDGTYARGRSDRMAGATVPSTRIVKRIKPLSSVTVSSKSPSSQKCSPESHSSRPAYFTASPFASWTLAKWKPSSSCRFCSSGRLVWKKKRGTVRWKRLDRQFRPNLHACRDRCPRKSHDGRSRRSGTGGKRTSRKRN